MKVIGITGGMGTGKTTAAAMFRDLGAAVLDADKIAHDLLKPGTACFRAVVKLLGKDILRQGRIDRKRVAEQVFPDARRLKALEGIIHPKVEREMRARIAGYRKGGRVKAVVLDVPLLFEAGFDRLVDIIIVVSSVQKQQVERAVRNLGMTRAEALRRIRAQMPLKEKKLLADMVINNRGSRTELRREIRKIWKQLNINT